MPRKTKKHHIIYKTTNTVNNKFYIGMHSTDDLKDGYIGSGKKLKYSLAKYGVENHNFEILEFLENRHSLKIREAEIVNEEILKNPLCMNLTIGGHGGWDHVNTNPEIKRQRRLRSLGENNPMFGTSASDETRLKMSLAKSKIHKRFTLISPDGRSYVADLRSGLVKLCDDLDIPLITVLRMTKNKTTPKIGKLVGWEVLEEVIEL